MRFIKRMIMLAVAAVLLIWLLWIAKCEIFTIIYGYSFKNIDIDGVPSGESLKVLHCSDDYAEVYYLGDLSRLVTFRKKADRWNVSSVRVVRYAEDRGARLVIWPYFWHYVLTG